ncbi:PTPLA-domain-containing protein [Auriculariales sp. MPI-PUGE-AT-0066]|nr:PTPLA-domain-containing protein [Auriculariales sp. MPI-PUGE-AT-0066]
MSTRRSKQVAASTPPAVPEKYATPSVANKYVSYYLVAYNVLSALAWGYVLVVTTAHLAGLTRTAQVAAPSQTTTTFFGKFAASIPFLRSSAPVAAKVQSHLPAFIQRFVTRASTTYAAVGPQTAIVQSFAVLEVLHAYLRWVRSPVPTTAMQVASRLVLVWGVAEQHSSARESPFYGTMVWSWAFTEVIRYAFYATSLLQQTPPWLTWLRYTTFFVLYPTGAGSEAFDMFATLPPVPSKTAYLRWFQTAWTPGDYVRAVLFMIWWPGLYVMYTYMIGQRKKVLGSGLALNKLKTQ